MSRFLRMLIPVCENGSGKILRQKDEELFIKVLTSQAICDMIAAVWFMDCCGDADAAAEAPSANLLVLPYYLYRKMGSILQ
ncbi:MAG: hypothetical protein ABI406_13465 [Ktedonobacteraceae bacterium]